MEPALNFVCVGCGRSVEKLHAKSMCYKCYLKNWHQRNPTYTKDYQKENKSHIQEYAKIYGTTNRARKRKINREWHEKNPDKQREYHQNDYMKHREKRIKASKAARDACNPLKLRNARLRFSYGPGIDAHRKANPQLFEIPHPSSICGIYIEWYYVMLDQQRGMCANPGCGAAESRREGKVRPLEIDHNHETGAVRGLLCNSCNVSLGRLYENVQRIEGLASYIRAYQPKDSNPPTACA